MSMNESPKFKPKVPEETRGGAETPITESPPETKDENPQKIDNIINKTIEQKHGEGGGKSGQSQQSDSSGGKKPLSSGEENAQKLLSKPNLGESARKTLLQKYPHLNQEQPNQQPKLAEKYGKPSPKESTDRQVKEKQESPRSPMLEKLKAKLASQHGDTANQSPESAPNNQELAEKYGQNQEQSQDRHPEESSENQNI